jgi:hypothetical protein
MPTQTTFIERIKLFIKTNPAYDGGEPGHTTFSYLFLHIFSVKIIAPKFSPRLLCETKNKVLIVIQRIKDGFPGPLKIVCHLGLAALLNIVHK